MEGYLQEQANRHGYVMAACDWWGMSSEDVPAVVAMTSGDISDFAMLPERLTQGVLNALVLMRILKVCNIIIDRKFGIHMRFIHELRAAFILWQKFCD